MLANLNERVEQLARMAVLTDSGDLAGLVAIQEQASVLASELESDQSDALAELAQQIGSLAEAIVMRKVLDADAAFNEIGAVIDRMARAASNPRADAPESREDNELITAWIGSCEGMLADLEGRLLALEKAPEDREVIAEIRRTMHTLKGECGVLSLHTAQQLCHEGESLIDARLSLGLAVPIDPFLALLDWLKNYTVRLSADHSATPDDPKLVMTAILAAHPPIQKSNTQIPNSPETAAKLAPHAPSRPASHPTDLPSPAAAPAVQIESVVDTTPLKFAAQPGTEENLADFLCEAKDHISNSEEALLALDQDRENIELINTVFRAFHTIKGVSGFMALKPIVSLAHSAEQLLDGARSGTIAMGRLELDLILASCDMMTRLLGVLEGTAGPTRGEFELLVGKLDGAAKTAGSGTRQDSSSTTSKPPTVAAAATPGASNSLESCVSAPAEPALIGVTEVEAKPRLAAESTVNPATDHEANLAAKARKGDQTVKVSTTRMDSLVTMVGELVIAQQMVVQDVASVAGNGQRVQRTLSHMGKMIRDLQEVSMSLRMVNLKSTFQKMTRLVRDVSQKAGKQIEVTTEGDDVELDRNVVEAITDPLVHMIRNSCDHGVEGVDERRAAGKNPIGHVALRAYHAGGSIVIEISDDGRGLRREKLIAKAKSKGILPPDTDETAMPDSEVFAIIFLPGFSTAEKVTDISGRGVGMDVVRRNIEALRGKIEIRSTPGKGTTFLLRLPLTMAIIDGMVVRVGKQRYVLPTLSIQQSFRPKDDDIKTAVGLGEMVNVRGSMLPIYRLNRVLNLQEGLEQIADALLIVMEADDSRFCLMVDEILGQHQVVIKTLTQTGQQLKGVSGGAILGDGRVALILDVAQVVSLAREGSGEPIPQRRMNSDAGVLIAAA